MVIAGLLMIGLVLFVSAGVAMAGVAIAQEEYSQRIRMEAEANRLRARGLPPRKLDIWLHRPRGGVRVITCAQIDADVVVEALTLVAKGVRAFSVEGLRGVLTRSEVESLRSEVFKLGLAEWHPSGPNAGIVWTEDGQALLDTLAGKSPGEEGVCMGMYASAGGNGHQ